MNALAESGIRALFFRCSNDEEFAPGFLESTVDISGRSRDLLKTWKGNERLGVGVGPIVPWSATESYWADTVDMARDGDTLVHLHTPKLLNIMILSRLELASGMLNSWQRSAHLAET